MPGPGDRSRPMKAAAWSVRRESAEQVRQELRDGGWLRDDLRVRRDDTTVHFPLRSHPDPPPREGSPSEAEFEELPPASPRSYRDLLEVPEADRDEFPKAYDVVGDIVLVRIPPEMSQQARNIGRALLEFVPGARLVARDLGVHGTERRRKLERIAGKGSFRTRHTENGIVLEVDVERAYFSPRLGREHARVAEAVRSGERVLDLCCGVGPFCLAIARAGKASSIVAVDLNPDAIDLLNVSRARVPGGERITPVLSPLERFLPTAGVADRVILNLPHDGIKYATSVVTTVAPSGTFHYYEVTERTSREGRPDALARLLGPPGSWTCRSSHTVHPYSPSSDLVAYTLERGGD